MITDQIECISAVDVRAVFTEVYEQEFIHQKGVLKQNYLKFLMELNDHLENESIYMQDLGTSNESDDDET